MTDLGSNGFSVGAANAVNGDGNDFVAWCWNAGDTTVVNNEGKITSQVRSNGDFSIVKFAAQSSAGTVGHGLKSPPKFILLKTIDTSMFWQVYSSGLGTQRYLKLNEAAGSVPDATVFSTSPTASVFDPGTGYITGNGYGDTIT